MNYSQTKPITALSQYVRCIWTLEGISANPLSTERVLPDGCMEMLFHYGDTFSCKQGNQSARQPRGFVFGQLSSSIELAAGKNIGIVAVRFQPNGLQAFTSMPLTEISDRWLSLRELWGKRSYELEQRLGESKHNDERIALVQQFLLEQLLLANASYDYMVDTCVSRILNSNGKASIDELTSGFKMSYRQMERRFTATVGLHPKVLSRIVRFQNTLKLVHQPYINSLNGLAYEAGYYDYTHMSRDFKSFVGDTPGNYFAQHEGMARLLASEV